jgi:hypothetical protein
MDRSLATSMGSECVEFAEKEFHEDKELKIQALGIKREGFSFLGVSSEEYARACDEVLSAIEEYESTAIPEDILLAKYMAH